MTLRVVVLDAAPLDAGDVSWSPIEALGVVERYSGTAPSETEGRCRGADVVLTNKVRLDPTTFTAPPTFGLVSVLATGHDTVTLRGVTVCNVPGYSTASTAQLTIALLLELAHRAGDHSREVHSGRWSSSETFAYWSSPQVELEGRTLAVVGAGAIGSRVATIAEALGMCVLRTSAPGRSRAGTVPWADAIGSADVVSLHCPLNDHTRGLIDASTLRRLRPRAWLINTARGGLVDEAAVAAALADGHLGGFAADVVQTEPPRAGSPLFGAPRCVLTPHVGWATAAARQRLIDATAANISGWLAGTPSNVVRLAGA